MVFLFLSFRFSFRSCFEKQKDSTFCKLLFIMKTFFDAYNELTTAGKYFYFYTKEKRNTNKVF